MPDSQNAEKRKKPVTRKRKPAPKKSAPEKSASATTRKRVSKKKQDQPSVPLPVMEEPQPAQQKDAPVELPRLKHDPQNVPPRGLVDVARRAGRTAGRIARIADLAVDTVLVAAKKISRKR